VIKSSIATKHREDGFKMGDLVGLDMTKYTADMFYIVLVESVVNKTTFTGTVVHISEKSPYDIGTHVTSFNIGCFKNFNGVLTLETLQ
jgi:hypothetical protein